MDYHNIHMLLLLLLVTLITTLSLSHCEPASSGSNSWTCDERPYKCGTLSNISGPFWGDNRPPSCGGGDPFKLTCNHTTTTSIEIGAHNFTVKDINITAQTMRLVRTDLALNLCFPQYFEDTYLSPTMFWYPSSVYNLTVFYNCSSTSDTTITTTTTRSGNFSCGNENALFCDGTQDELLKTFPWLEKCNRHLQVSVDTPYDYIGGRDFLKQALRQGFSVNYIDPDDKGMSSISMSSTFFYHFKKKKKSLMLKITNLVYDL